MMQMTDEQVLTVAMGVILPVSALIYSNSRVTDVNKNIDAAKETLRAEMRTLNAELRGEMAGLRSEMAELRGDIKAGFERMEAALKQHILEYHK
jgi:ATP/maltotriose-dependent transcriptional regulator MalT